MKKIILALAIMFSALGSAQISVGPKHIGKPGKFDKKLLEKFKKTKTIFVLSNIYDQQDYEDVLKESWTVTPYKLVKTSEFDLKDYLKDEYSIATLRGHMVERITKSGGIVKYLHMYLELAIYENEKLLEKLVKNAGKKEEKLRNIINKHKISFARFELFPKDDFIKKALTYSNEELNKELMEATLNEDVFYNYSLGILKNYFQKTSNLLSNEQIYWMYKDEKLPELKELATKILYIPNYTKIKYNPFAINDSQQEEEKIDKIYSEYEFSYEFIDAEDLNTRILNNEEFYYLRYVRVNTQKFIEIVNAKNGEVIYRNYETGLAYNLKRKHIKELNQDIKKVVKKASKK